MARFRSDFWVQAYIRQRQVEGVPAVLRRRGAAEAGAIFVKVDRLDGTALLFGPAPPSLDDEGGDRRFHLVTEGTGLDIEDRMEREARFDSDLWLVEIEDRSGDPRLPS